VSEANVLTCPLDQSALLRSSADVDLIDEDGIPTYLQRFPYADHSMPARANDSVSYVAKGHRYAVRSEQPNTARDFTLSGAANQPLELALAAGAAPTTVTLDGVALPPQASLAALRSSATSGFFFGAEELTVRVLGTQAEQKLVLAGDFLTNSTPGRLATALPAGAVEGASVSIIPGAAPAYLRRYALPTQAPRVTRLVQSSRLDDATGAAALADLAPGEAAVVTGFFEAPEAGTYRLGLWGAGGGSALFVGGRWVMGEPNAGINSNYVRNGQLTTDATSFQVHGVVALQAGWHPFTALLAKQPGNTGAPVLHLRLTKPSTFSTWEYANLRRAP
jgi:hypothetical protein